MRYIKNVSILVLLFAVACSIKSPQAPSWQTTLNVPLVNRLYTVAEMLKDRKDVVFDENGRLGFHIEESIDAARLGENFKLDGFEQSVQVGLPDMLLPAFNVSHDRFLFSRLCPQVAGKEGQNIVVQACSYQRLAGQTNNDPTFRSATIAKGIGWLRIYNRLPVAVENVTLQLRDIATGDITINAPRVNRINANDSATVQLVLDGKRLPENSQWLISGSIPGSNGSAVSIQSNQVVEVVTRIEQARMSRIEAKVSGISLMMSKSIELFPGTAITVEELAFQKGTVTISVDNMTPFSSAGFELLFDQIKNSNSGAPLTYAMSLQPFTKTVRQLDLHQFVARLDLPADGSQQSLNVDITGFTDDLSDRLITLDEKSLITVKMTFSDLVIDHLSGRLAEQQVALDTMKKSITLPDRFDDLDNVHFGDAKMTMDIFNTIEMPIRFEGKLWAYNGKGNQVYFTINEQIKAGNTSGEVCTRISVFTSQNSDIVKFMDIRPNLFVATGQAWVGDGITYGKVKASDYIRAKVMVDVPAKATWTSKEVHLDTTQINIKPLNAEGDVYDNTEITQISGDATDNLVSAKISAKIENHLPVGGALYLQLADTLAQLNDKPNVVLGPINLGAGTTDAMGRVVQARTVEATLELSERDMEVFRNSTGKLKPVFIAADLKLDGTNGQERQVFDTDYVKIQALLTCNVLVKKD